MNKNIYSIITKYLNCKYLQELKEAIKYIKYNDISYEHHFYRPLNDIVYIERNINEYIYTYIEPYIRKVRNHVKCYYDKKFHSKWVIENDIKLLDIRYSYIVHNKWNFDISEYEDIDLLHVKVY